MRYRKGDVLFYVEYEYGQKLGELDVYINCGKVVDSDRSDLKFNNCFYWIPREDAFSSINQMKAEVLKIKNNDVRKMINVKLKKFIKALIK